MATNLIYSAPGSIVTFAATGIGDVLWTPQNEGYSKGRMSAAWDRGAGPWPIRYKWRMRTRWAPTAGASDALWLYIIGSDDPTDFTRCDGACSIGDWEWTNLYMLNFNCQMIGVVTSAGLNQPESGSGICQIFTRYAAVCMWNAAASRALTNTATDHVFTLQEFPDEVEAAS